MKEILESLPVYMMIGIIAVVAISQANRIVGGILGVVFWITAAAVGSAAYDQGGAIGLATVKFSREVFYGLCAAFALLHAFTAYKAYARKRQFPGVRPPLTQDDDEDD